MSKCCNRVFIIGLDGAGNAIQKANTPNIDDFFAKGAVTYNARTSIPTISAECWGSLIHGVGPEKHKLTNSIVGTEKFPEDSLYPSFFKLARKAWPDCKLASFSCWDPINCGIIESSCDCHLVSKGDSELAPSIVEYISSNDPKILFVQLDDIDGAGHTHGYWTSDYYQQIENTDKLVGMIFNAIREANYLEDSLVILCADHGGGGGAPKSHGSQHDLDVNIFWGCRGPGVKSGTEIKSNVNIKDTAAVAAYALGLEIPETWDCKVPEDLFE